VDKKIFYDLVMSPFNIVEQCEKERKNDKSIPNTSNISTSNEWNALMEHFIDANQDEITKQMNDYVKEKRWECAMKKLGPGKNVTTTPVQSDDITKEISGECEDLLCSHDEERNRLVRDDEDIPHDDMGELVTMQLGHEDLTTQPTASVADAIDENMARIIRGKVERQSASKFAATSAEMFKSKKKNRKKKKRKQESIVDDIAAQGIAEQIPHQNHSDDADRTEPTDVASIRSDTTVLDRLDHPKEVAAAMATASASFDAATDDGVPNQAQQLTDASKTKKDKMKKKATKKKRKSTSVIDDIFGF
jgi:hypothetical protein